MEMIIHQTIKIFSHSVELVNFSFLLPLSDVTVYLYATLGRIICNNETCPVIYSHYIITKEEHEHCLDSRAFI